jgi:hypothetical protein
MSSSNGWIAVDLDGTLAHYDNWMGIHHIGEPIPSMVARVKNWVSQGFDVKIFTARVHNEDPEVRYYIEQWCDKHLGFVLPITNAKDFDMIELYDDRCVSVEENTGRLRNRSQRGLSDYDSL